MNRTGLGAEAPGAERETRMISIFLVNKEVKVVVRPLLLCLNHRGAALA